MFKPLGWYKTGLGLFITIFLGLIAAIFVDIIPQSFQTHQFWNAIIVASALFFTLIIYLAIFLTRFARDRVWIHHIPRDYTISRRDTPGRMIDIIDNCIRDCRRKFDDQVRGVTVDHPGLQSPSKGDEPLELPYTAIVEILPLFIEDNIMAFYSRFTRKKSDQLREYLNNAIRFTILPEDSGPLVESFLHKYERARFGNILLTEKEFYELFSQAVLLVRAINIPGGAPSMSPSPLENVAVDDDDASDAVSVIVREKQHTGSFLQTISRQPSFSTAIRNSGSELSLPELVQRYRTNSTRSSRERGSFSVVSSFNQSFGQIPEILVTKTTSRDSEESTHTFVHHETK